MNEKPNPFEEKKEVTKDDLKSVASIVNEVAHMIDGGGQKSAPSLSKVKDFKKKISMTERVNDLLAVTDEDNLLVWFLAYKNKLNKYRALTQEILPELMDDVGIPSLTLDNGLTVKIVDDVKTSLSEKKVQKAKHEMVLCELEKIWSTRKETNVSHNSKTRKEFDDDVKPDVVKMVNARFKNQLIISAPDKDTIDLLFDKGISYDQKETIHSATLKSTVKDMLARGVNVPESISVFEFREAVIK